MKIQTSQQLQSTPRCPYCRESIAPETPVSVCRDCFAPSHTDCWDENGQCPSCGSQNRIQQQQRIERSAQKPKAFVTTRKKTITEGSEASIPKPIRAEKHKFGELFVYYNFESLMQNLSLSTLRRWLPTRHRFDDNVSSDIVRNWARTTGISLFWHLILSTLFMSALSLTTFIIGVNYQSKGWFVAALLLFFGTIQAAFTQFFVLINNRPKVMNLINNAVVHPYLIKVHEASPMTIDHNQEEAAGATPFVNLFSQTLRVEYIAGSVPPSDLRPEKQVKDGEKSIDLYSLKLCCDNDSVKVNDILLVSVASGIVVGHDRFRKIPF